MSQEEKKWRARDDARVLADYQEILADKTRLKLAKTEASKQAKELNTRLNAFNKVAKTKVTKTKGGK